MLPVCTAVHAVEPIDCRFVKLSILHADRQRALPPLRYQGMKKLTTGRMMYRMTAHWG